MADTLTLDAVNNLEQALARVDDGLAALRLIRRLSLWTEQRSPGGRSRTEFPRQLSNLNPDEISDLAARVAAEIGILYELVGVLRGIQGHLKIRCQQVRGRARTRIRREHREGTAGAQDGRLVKALTKAEVDDAVEDDPDVRASDQQYSLVSLLLASADGALSGGLTYKETVSREITMRGNMIAGGIH